MRAFTGQNVVYCGIGGGGEGGGVIWTVVKKANRQLWNGLTGVGYGDGCCGILHIAELSKCADCMTW